MRLQQWAANGWLRPHQTTKQQIADLLAIVDRDLDDSTRDLSADWQFGIAYNAVLKLYTILLYASGFRPEKNLAHYRTLQALPIILGPARSNDADYLDSCRTKRNTAEYDTAGTVRRPKPPNYASSPENSKPRFSSGSVKTIRQSLEFSVHRVDPPCSGASAKPLW